jgi:Na+/proline symporter
VLQSIIFVGCAVFAIWLVYSSVDGGPAGVVRAAAEADKFNVFELDFSLVSASIWIAVVGGIFFNAYPMMAEQTVVQKYLATAGTKQAARAVWTNAALTIPIQLLFFGLGTGLWAFYRQRPEQLDTSLQSDSILPQFVMQEFPVGVKGAFIAGLFAASMSSLASSMNSMATVTVNDFYRRFARNVSDARALMAARGFTALYGLFATGASLYVATTQRAGTMFQLFISFLGLLGGGLAALFVLGTCTKRANGLGAMIGAIVSGLVMYTVAKIEDVPLGSYTLHPTQLHGFLHPVLGFMTCLVVGYLASLATPNNLSRDGAKPQRDPV